MTRLGRPWDDQPLSEGRPFKPNNCLLGEAVGRIPRDLEHTVLMHGRVENDVRYLLLHPYPRHTNAEKPDRQGFPLRPRIGQEAHTKEEIQAHAALVRMNEVLARIQELEEALDDPANLWSRLRKAWKRAENEADPRMAEIVRQAREVDPVLRVLKRRIRRVLSRTRELTPLDRAQELDRASMRWLSRQPGRTTAERAGADQRILAIVRHENFDTLENRVIHAYARLAADVSREWLMEHPRAEGSQRYWDVESYRKHCRTLTRELTELGIGVAEPGITPNYVLLQDKGYRTVHGAWVNLLQRERVIDDLWAWQAQTWTDFAVLAIVLALDEMEDSKLIAQSPIVWREEAAIGRWFAQDRPAAVFWLNNIDRIVEVQSRPENPSHLLTRARAHVSLKIADPNRSEFSCRVAVWTPHAMERIDLIDATRDAARLIQDIQRVRAQEIAQEKMRDGLILVPAHGAAQAVTEVTGSTRVHGIALDASGQALAEGFDALRRFARSDFYRGIA